MKREHSYSIGDHVTKNDQRFVYDGYLQIGDFHSSTSTSPFNSLYEYAPFGALTAQSGESAAENPWRFSSEYAEDETATVYYNYRHYEAGVGRWMSRDPIGVRGGVNIFACASNRLNWDRLGLDSWGDFPGGTWGDDPNFWNNEWHRQEEERNRKPPSKSGSAAGSFLFSKWEIARSHGCSYFCYAVTTQLAGLSGGGSIGGGPLSIGGGWWGGYGEISPSDEFGVGGGVGLSLLPAEGSWRLFCFKLNDENEDGCPCDDYAPSSTLGVRN